MAGGQIDPGELPGYLGYQSDPTLAVASGNELVDMSTRYEASWLGRFTTTADVLMGKPRDPQSMNRWIYGEDDPITFNDPGCAPRAANVTRAHTLATWGTGIRWTSRPTIQTREVMTMTTWEARH
jgi:hypothetical protein